MREKYRRFFLAGFIEGEGTLTVVVRHRNNLKFGVSIDPELYLYQHSRRRAILELAKDVFKSGSIYSKADNPNILVFAIRDRRTIYEKVIPFFERYVLPFGVRYKHSFPVFKEIVERMMRKEHLTYEGIKRLLKLVKKFRALNK